MSLSTHYRMFFEERLQQLRELDNDRHLRVVHNIGNRLEWEGREYLNLSSNDYLGFADVALQGAFFKGIDPEREFLMSNPASRLMTGNDSYDTLETTLAGLYPGKSALVLGSGYLTNTGVLPAVTTSRDLILADKFVHASLIDGLRLSEAQHLRFRHNDLNHLETLLSRNTGKYDQIYVVTESLFSMDGDRAPLGELVALKRKYGFRLYLDEAHAFGVYGERGAGLAQESGVGEEVDFLVATLGKAASSQGAFVACPEIVRTFLVNRMRTLIFSTALPPISLRWSQFVVNQFGGDFWQQRRDKLQSLIGLLAQRLELPLPQSQIIPIVVGENSRALELSAQLREAGFWVNAVRYPTVPEGTARLRISLSGGMDSMKISEFVIQLNRIWKNIG